MQVLKSPRLVVATACVLAWLGAVRAAERSPAAMAEAAGKFLAGLSADQRQQATFAFDSPAKYEAHIAKVNATVTYTRGARDWERALLRRLRS